MKARIEHIIRQLKMSTLDAAERYDLEVELEKYLNNDESYINSFK